MRSSLAAVAAALIGLPAAAPATQAEEGWIWPVRGEVLTAYVNDNARPYAGGMHRGIDIAADEGTPVLASRSGTVTFAGALGSSGIVVAVRSDDGRHVASYLHLAAESVSRGEHVAAGTRIGAVGTTGRRSVAAPHLHFGVRLANAEDHYVDPLSLLPPLGAAEVAPVPVPVAAPVPVRAQEEVVRVPVPVRARRAGAVAPRSARLRPRGSLLPGPVPRAGAVGVAARKPAVPREARVPAGRVTGPRTGPVRHPVAAPAAGHRRDGTADRGRPLMLAGLGLLAVVLFGGVVVRLNTTVNRRAVALARWVRRQPLPISASASISTFQRGSRKPVTTTIVDTGRASPKAPA